MKIVIKAEILLGEGKAFQAFEAWVRIPLSAPNIVKGY